MKENTRRLHRAPRLRNNGYCVDEEGLSDPPNHQLIRHSMDNRSGCAADITLACMDALTLVSEHSWDTTDFPLCQVSIPIDALAMRVGASVREWDEDGLGTARGFF